MTREPTTQFSARYVGHGWELSVAGPYKQTLVFGTTLAMLSWIDKNLEVPEEPPAGPPGGDGLAIAA